MVLDAAVAGAADRQVGRAVRAERDRPVGMPAARREAVEELLGPSDRTVAERGAVHLADGDEVHRVDAAGRRQ
jgi:hypothetical protein